MEKNNRYIKNTIIVFTTMLNIALLGGCADVEFEENPPSILSPNSFFTSESEFDAAIVGTYRALYSDWSGYDYGYDLLLASGAEDVRSDADIFKNIDRLNPNDGEEVIRGFWLKHYQCIANANTIIGNLKNASGISDERLAELGGQAKFLRALAFFDLVRFFGEVQLTTFENQGDIDNLKQATVQEVYSSIIDNLKDAEAGLPIVFPGEPGRPTKGAAKALLAKVYLTMTGWPLEDTSKYAEARDKALEVMGMGYNLEPNFADLWTQEKKLTTPEFIFTFYGSIDQGGSFGSHMHTATRFWGNGEGGWGDYFSETRFFDVFPDGPRKEASFTSVFADGTTFTEAGVEPYIAKYRDAGRTTGSNGEGFRPILRYADVLLIYAEAANMAEGSPSQAAYNAINAVRERAGLSDLPSGMSQSDFDEAVLAERNWELAFEGNRWHDLVRKKMVIEVNKDVHPNVSETNRLLPKPGAQLIPGILEQNQGY